MIVNKVVGYNFYDLTCDDYDLICNFYVFGRGGGVLMCVSVETNYLKDFSSTAVINKSIVLNVKNN